MGIINSNNTYSKFKRLVKKESCKLPGSLNKTQDITEKGRNLANLLELDLEK